MPLVYLWFVHLKHGVPAGTPFRVCRFVEYPNVKRWVCKRGGVAGVAPTTYDGEFLQFMRFLFDELGETSAELLLVDVADGFFAVNAFGLIRLKLDKQVVRAVGADFQNLSV